MNYAHYHLVVGQIIFILNPMLNNHGGINKQFTDLSKDELLTKLNNLKQRLTNAKAASLLIYLMILL